ncbi:MAG: tyrosine--tRNA ligase [Thermoproteota archaeon]
MDVEEKIGLVKSVGEEIITLEELKTLLETKDHPVAYDGFEPSGLSHIAFGVFRPLLLESLIKAGIRFKLYLADWFAWINRKLEGDLEKIRLCGEYFMEVWKAAGVDFNSVEVVWASDLVNSSEYWKNVVQIAKLTTVSRAERALTIMGRKKGELKEVAQYFYPMMQVTDIFMLGADICQLGLDQRRANMLAREIGPKLGYWKPVVVSHHMLMGLQGVKEPEGFDEDKRIDVLISSKMSKSKPESSVFVHDSREIIFKKVLSAYCPEKVAENNPVLDWTKHIIFRKFGSLKVERPSKYGGPLEFHSYEELEAAYVKGLLHPLDLKNAVADAIDKLVDPIRRHFEENSRARALYEALRKAEISR